MSPCSKLFGIVTTRDKLLIKLLVPDLIGAGKVLYTLAAGLNIILSNPWLSAKEALLNPSKQSLTTLLSDFFERAFSPSVPAFTLKVKIAEKKLIF